MQSAVHSVVRARFVIEEAEIFSVLLSVRQQELLSRFNGSTGTVQNPASIRESHQIPLSVTTGAVHVPHPVTGFVSSGTGVFPALLSLADHHRVLAVHNFSLVGSEVHTYWNNLSFIKHSQAGIRNAGLSNF